AGEACGFEGEVEQNRGGNEEAVLDRIVVKPWMIVWRDVPGEDQSRSLGKVHYRVDQRMVSGRRTADRGWRTVRAVFVDPEALALERVRRQIDALRARLGERGGPVDRCAGNVQSAESTDEGRRLGMARA